MNYSNIYEKLIERGKLRTLTGYKESHHIIPRCMGGNDEIENLVDLTPEEHYLAHQLLVKIYPNNHSLIRAAIMMVPNRPSNKMYGWLKRKFSDAQSKGQSKENNSQFGTRWVHNKKLKQCKKIKGTIEDGWEEGRKINWEAQTVCNYCKNQFIPNANEIFCSVKCKQYFRSPASKIIDDNIENMIDVYTKCKSITKTLHTFGINGVREGNSYFSNILKERGIEVLRRRNSK